MAQESRRMISIDFGGGNVLQFPDPGDPEQLKQIIRTDPRVRGLTLSPELFTKIYDRPAPAMGDRSLMPPRVPGEARIGPQPTSELQDTISEYAPTAMRGLGMAAPFVMGPGGAAVTGAAMFGGARAMEGGTPGEVAFESILGGSDPAFNKLGKMAVKGGIKAAQHLGAASKLLPEQMENYIESFLRERSRRNPGRAIPPGAPRRTSSALADVQGQRTARINEIPGEVPAENLLTATTDLEKKTPKVVGAVEAKSGILDDQADLVADLFMARTGLNEADQVAGKGLIKDIIRQKLATGQPFTTADGDQIRAAIRAFGGDSGGLTAQNLGDLAGDLGRTTKPMHKAQAAAQQTATVGGAQTSEAQRRALQGEIGNLETEAVRTGQIEPLQLGPSLRKKPGGYLDLNKQYSDLKRIQEFNQHLRGLGGFFEAPGQMGARGGFGAGLGMGAQSLLGAMGFNGSDLGIPGGEISDTALAGLLGIILLNPRVAGGAGFATGRALEAAPHIAKTASTAAGSERRPSVRLRGNANVIR